MFNKEAGHPPWLPRTMETARFGGSRRASPRTHELLPQCCENDTTCYPGSATQGAHAEQVQLWRRTRNLKPPSRLEASTARARGGRQLRSSTVTTASQSRASSPGSRDGLERLALNFCETPWQLPLYLSAQARSTFVLTTRVSRTNPRNSQDSGSYGRQRCCNEGSQE